MALSRQRLIRAGAVVPWPNRAVTLVRRADGSFPGTWVLPGVSVRPKETAAAALHRALPRQLGVHVERFVLLGTYEFLGRGRLDGYHELVFAYQAVEPAPAAGVRGRPDVDGVRRARPGELSIHPTALRILADAGLAALDPAAADGLLTAAGITAYCQQVRSTAEPVGG